MHPPEYESQLLLQPEAARYLRLSQRQLQRLDELGIGPAKIRLSARRIAYPRDGLDAWINARAIVSKVVVLSEPVPVLDAAPAKQPRRIEASDSVRSLVGLNDGSSSVAGEGLEHQAAV